MVLSTNREIKTTTFYNSDFSDRRGEIYTPERGMGRISPDVFGTKKTP